MGDGDLLGELEVSDLSDPFPLHSLLPDADPNLWRMLASFKLTEFMEEGVKEGWGDGGIGDSWGITKYFWAFSVFSLCWNKNKIRKLWIFPRFSIWFFVIMNYQFDSGWSGCPWWSSSTGTGMWMKHFSRWQCWRFQAWRCRWWSSSGNWSWGWVAFGTATAFRTWVVQLQVRGAFFGLSIVSTIGFEWYSWKEKTMINYVLCASCLEFIYILWVCILETKYSTLLQ